jgi:hypothetical protein
MHLLRKLEEAGHVHPVASSVAAGLTGVVAAAASHTFDTAKSLQIVMLYLKYMCP